MRLLFLEATVDFRDSEVALEMEWASYCDMLLWNVWLDERTYERMLGLPLMINRTQRGA